MDSSHHPPRRRPVAPVKSPPTPPSTLADPPRYIYNECTSLLAGEAGVVWKWPGLRQRSLLLEGVRMGSDATHIRVSSTFFIPSYCIPVTMPAEFEKVTVTRPLDITITQYTKSEDTDDVALVDMNCEDFKEATPSRLDIEATSKEMVLMKH
ncbi:hypothetical protein RHGRI_005812 [Rhododendron griersonianum]|uniref:Uncharacterized protein n=1 Tax=Rhododendron griersonianum TaxID=479676 RepID=A0AAV6LES2_9ERIC|nr:hypothetical protein RHGRI_005812 [Rhododendron griersonianum]